MGKIKEYSSLSLVNDGNGKFVSHANGMSTRNGYSISLLPWFCCIQYNSLEYTGAPLLGTPILRTHYMVSCDAEVCGVERESSRMICTERYAQTDGMH